MTSRISLLHSSFSDLSLLPHSNKIQDKTQVTLGDAHGNTIKIIWELVYNGICNIKQKYYQTLFDIYYKKNKASKEEQQTFLNIVQKNLNIIDQKTLVRFIGDIMSDRGANDLYTCEVLLKLHKAKAQVCIILSNHDIKFIRAIINYERNDNILYKEEQGENSSLTGLQKSIESGITNIQSIRKKYKQSYLNKLKLIDYSLSNDKNQITLFSHAPIDLPAIKKISDYLDVDFDDSTHINLSSSITKINQKVISSLRDNNFELLYLSKSPIHYCVWNRNENLQVASTSDKTSITKKNISFVYGHTKNNLSLTKERNENSFRIDNELGKYYLNNNQEKIIGIYQVHISNDDVSPPASSYQKCERIEYFNQKDLDKRKKRVLEKAFSAKQDIKKSSTILSQLSDKLVQVPSITFHIDTEKKIAIMNIKKLIKQFQVIETSFSQLSNDYPENLDHKKCIDLISAHFNILSTKKKRESDFRSIRKSFPLTDILSVKKELPNNLSSLYEFSSIVISLFMLTKIDIKKPLLISLFVFIAAVSLAITLELSIPRSISASTVLAATTLGVSFFSINSIEMKKEIKNPTTNHLAP